MEPILWPPNWIRLVVSQSYMSSCTALKISRTQEIFSAKFANLSWGCLVFRKLNLEQTPRHHHPLRYIMMKRRPSPIPYLCVDTFDTQIQHRLQPCLTPQPSKSYREIPIELWYRTFEFLVPADITCPTHRILVQVRGVCPSWRKIAQRLIWEGMKSLVASPKLFDSPSDGFPRDFPHEIQLWLEESLNRLAEGHKRGAHRGSDSGGELRLVAFHFDERYHPDQNLAKFFISALSNCVRADITIDHFPTSTNPLSSYDAHGIRSLPSIPLRQFSFSSMDLGIRDTLPQQFDFPWHSLRQDLPWSQLTDITLDCVLSYDDALAVLSAAVNVGRAELGRLSSTGVGNSAMVKITSTLHTLKINTSIDLRPLFSRLDLPALEDLQLAVYLDSITSAPKDHILNASLNVRWHCLKRLSLQSDLTYRQCDLGSILRHCHQLNQLKWEGDHSEFNDLPLEALARLQGLIFVSDPDGHQLLFKKISFLPDIIKISLSHYHALLGGNHNLPNLSHITISGPITLGHLFQILRSRTRRLLSGDFRLSTVVTQFRPAPLRCEALQVLKLVLVDAPSFPWGKLNAPQLKTLKINVRNTVQASMRREMEAFRSVHLDTIISISSH